MTLRELLMMADGAFTPTAALICQQHNMNLEKGKRPAVPDDFNPYADRGRRRERIPLTAANRARIDAMRVKAGLPPVGKQAAIKNS